MKKILGITFLTLFCFELAAWVIGFRPEYVLQVKGIRGPEGSLRFTLDPTRLYRLIPHAPARINSMGYRDGEFGKKGKYRILSLGDSFTMGLVVPQEKTFSKRLETKLGSEVEVLNLGILGLGPDQELTILEEDGPKLKPDAVLLNIFPGNDFFDLEKNDIFSINEKGELIRDSRNYLIKAIPFFRLEMLYRLIFTKHFLRGDAERRMHETLFNDTPQVMTDTVSPKSKRVILLMKLILKRFKEITDTNKQAFVVTIIPRYDSLVDDHRLHDQKVPKELYFKNEQIVQDLCHELGIQVVNFVPEFQAVNSAKLFEPEDEHFSMEGHELVADKLQKILGPVIAAGRQ